MGDFGFSVHVLYFAALRELMRRTEEELMLPATVRTVADFVEFLSAVHPELNDQLSSIRYALDGEFVALDRQLTPGGEIALLPPFSGG